MKKERRWFFKLKQMGRNRIHDEQASYFERYGRSLPMIDNRSLVTPNYLYEVYVAHGHYRRMAVPRMKELFKQMIPGLTDQKRKTAMGILKGLS